MNDDWLAERFEDDRAQLQAVVYRLLGSASEADDAVQETRGSRPPQEPRHPRRFGP